jgi:hypothetical protein
MDNIGAVYFREFGTFVGDESALPPVALALDAGCRHSDGNLEYDCSLSSLSIATDRAERHRTSARRRISHPAMRLLRNSLRRTGTVQNQEGIDI